MQYTLSNGKQLNIRPVRLADAEGLIALLTTVDGETKFLAREIGEFCTDVLQEKAFIQRLLDNKRRVFLVAEVDGKIVGNCSLDLVRNLKRYLHRSTMGITVIKDYWRMGIGSLLLTELLQQAKQLGYEQVELTVVATNSRAIALYERFGFEKVGVNPKSLKYADGSYVDEYNMIKFL